MNSLTHYRETQSYSFVIFWIIDSVLTAMQAFEFDFSIQDMRICDVEHVKWYNINLTLELKHSHQSKSNLNSKLIKSSFLIQHETFDLMLMQASIGSLIFILDASGNEKLSHCKRSKRKYSIHKYYSVVSCFDDDEREKHFNWIQRFFDDKTSISINRKALRRLVFDYILTSVVMTNKSYCG